MTHPKVVEREKREIWRALHSKSKMTYEYEYEYFTFGIKHDMVLQVIGSVRSSDDRGTGDIGKPGSSVIVTGVDTQAAA